MKHLALRKFIIFKVWIKFEYFRLPDFIKLASFWRKGIDFPIEDCLFFNFGYEKELPYTQIRVGPHEDFRITINSHGIEAPNGCSIVLISGKFLDKIDDIMQKMDDLAEQMESLPIAVFLIPTYRNSGEVNFNTYYRNDNSPPMVPFTHALFLF